MLAGAMLLALCTHEIKAQTIRTDPNALLGKHLLDCVCNAKWLCRE